MFFFNVILGFYVNKLVGHVFLCVLLALPTNIVADDRESDPLADKSAKVVNYAIWATAAVVAAVGGAALLKYLTKNPDQIIKKIDPEKFKDEGVSSEQLRRSGLYRNYLESRGYKTELVDGERRVFATGYTPQEKLQNYLTSLDADALKHGIAVEELAKLSPRSSSRAVVRNLDRTKYVLHGEHIFPRNFTPIDQTVRYLDTLSAESFSKGVSIEQIRDHILSKRSTLSVKDLRFAASRHRDSLVVETIEVGGRQETLIFPRDNTPAQQIQAKLDYIRNHAHPLFREGLENPDENLIPTHNSAFTQFEIGVPIEELAKGIHRPAHWSEDELLQYIEKEIADNHDSIYKILKFARDTPRPKTLIFRRDQPLAKAKERIAGIRAQQLESDRHDLFDIDFDIDETATGTDSTNRKILNDIVKETTAQEEVKITDEFLNQIRKIISGIDDDFEALLKDGNIQEVIWQLRERGLLSQATELEELVTDVLKNGKIVVNSRRASGGVTGAYELVFANGMRAIAKHWHQAGAIAMSELDRLIGTNVFPLTVHRKIGHVQHYSVQLFVERAKHYGELNEHSDKLYSLAETKRIKLLAMLGGDWDSGSHNMMMPSKGRGFMIDAGDALTSYNAFLREASKLDEADKLDYKVYYRERGPVRLFLHKYSLMGIFTGEKSTDTQLHKRLAEIKDQEIEDVVDTVLAVFEPEELAVFKKINPEKFPGLNYDYAKYADYPEIEQLRTYYQSRWDEVPEDEIQKMLKVRLDYYRDIKLAPVRMRAIIDEYLDAIAVLDKAKN